MLIRWNGVAENEFDPTKSGRGDSSRIGLHVTRLKNARKD